MLGGLAVPDAVSRKLETPCVQELGAVPEIRALPNRPPAVDDQSVSCHVGETVGCQQRDGFSNVVGLGYPANRYPALDLGPEVRLIEPPLGHRGLDHAGTDCIGSDAIGCVVGGDGTGQQQGGGAE